MSKNYYLSTNIGKCKYVVSYHDGIKTHKDGSPFYDIETSNNKKRIDAFVRYLSKNGYSEK